MRHGRWSEKFQDTSKRYSRKEVVDIQSNEGRKILLQFTYYIVGLCRKSKLIHREINKIDANQYTFSRKFVCFLLKIFNLISIKLVKIIYLFNLVSEFMTPLSI